MRPPPVSEILVTAFAGFTLVELLVAVTVLGILLAVAVPAFTGMVLDSRRTTTANDLLSGLKLARSEAMKRALPVTVCPMASGGGCATGTDYSPGWLLFVDVDGNGTADTADWVDLDGDGTVDTGEAPHVLRAQAVDASGLTLTASGTGPIVMRPFNQVSTNATVTICDRRGSSEARAVIVAQSGRARVSQSAPGGGALSCP